MTYFGLSKIISGGQTGADQGGLLAAYQCGVLTGGTAPIGFMTSRGPNLLLGAFGLKAKGSIQARTKQNIVDADATVVIAGDLKSPGTVLTIRLAKELGRPLLAIDAANAIALYGGGDGLPGDVSNGLGNALYRFIVDNAVRTLNVAGNRERFDDSRMTNTTKVVVYKALQLLDLDNLLVRDTDL